jgi:type IV pilus assembly protein PilA
MKRFMKSFRYGEKGFTLIELLVVVAILGILAAVVIPNVGKFFGAGAVEAANTECANVVVAVAAYMADQQTDDFDGTVSATDQASPHPDDFLANQASLQATYSFTDATLIDAVEIADGKWDNAGLDFDTDTLTWYKP